MKYYIVTRGGLLRGYTKSRYVVDRIIDPSIDRFKRNCITVYHCISEYEIEETLKTYFAEEHPDYTLLEYYHLRVFKCHDNEDCVITCIHEIHELITETNCIDTASMALTKALHDLSLMGKYVVDKNFDKIIKYIMMKYTFKIFQWQYLGDSSKIDKVRLLLSFKYFDKINN